MYAYRRESVDSFSKTNYVVLYHMARYGQPEGTVHRYTSDWSSQTVARKKIITSAIGANLIYLIDA